MYLKLLLDKYETKLSSPNIAYWQHPVLDSNEIRSGSYEIGYEDG
jgi:hypothetical protein